MAVPRQAAAVFGLIVLPFSLALLAGAAVPVPRRTVSFSLDPENLSLPLAAEAAGTAARIPGGQQISLDYPVQLTLGRPERVRLSLGPSGEAPSATPVGPDVYATHNVVVVGQFRSDDLSVLPNGESGQPLLPGKAVGFEWGLTAARSGPAAATLFVRLQFFPRPGGSPLERTILARDLSLVVRPVLGLPGPTARAAGIVGAILGAAALAFSSGEWRRWLRNR